MKEESDNFRSCAVQDIIKELIRDKFSVIIYEPMLKEKYIPDTMVIKDLDKFLEESDIIIANRWSNELINVRRKVYTRDLFRRD